MPTDVRREGDALSALAEDELDAWEHQELGAARLGDVELDGADRHETDATAGPASTRTDAAAADLPIDAEEPVIDELPVAPRSGPTLDFDIGELVISDSGPHDAIPDPPVSAEAAATADSGDSIGDRMPGGSTARPAESMDATPGMAEAPPSGPGARERRPHTLDWLVPVDEVGREAGDESSPPAVAEPDPPAEETLDPGAVASSPRHESDPEPVAAALEEIARRIRLGELSPPATGDPVSDEAALALALAAVLGVRVR